MRECAKGNIFWDSSWRKKEWHFPQSSWSVVQTSDRSDGDKTTKTCGPYLTEKLALCVYFPKALHYYHPLYTIRPPLSVVHWTSSNDTFFAYFLVTKRSILQHCIGCWMLLLASLAKKCCQNDNALLLAKEFQVRCQFDTKNISLQEFQPNTRSRVHSTFEKIKITIRLTKNPNSYFFLCFSGKSYIGKTASLLNKNGMERYKLEEKKQLQKPFFSPSFALIDVFFF